MIAEPVDNAGISPLLPFCVKLLPDTQENREALTQLRRRLIGVIREIDGKLYDDRYKTVKAKHMR